MNVAQYKAGVQTELNGKTSSEQSSCKGNLNGHQLIYMKTQV